jgi:uncharacterized protein
VRLPISPPAHLKTTLAPNASRKDFCKQHYVFRLTSHFTSIQVMQSLPPSELIQQLRKAKNIAVVGISDDLSKASHYVSAYMQGKDYKIIPVNPKFALRGEKVLGETCWARLTDIPAELGPIDIVNCFRKTEDMLPVAQDAVAIKAGGLWQQVGIDNPDATQLALDAGMWCVTDQCLMVVHRNLIG